MKTEYDLSKMKSRKNPYATKLKKSVTMRLSEDVIGYFKEMAEEKGVPYQSLINLYLRDCVSSHRKIDITLAISALTPIVKRSTALATVANVQSMERKSFCFAHEIQ